MLAAAVGTAGIALEVATGIPQLLRTRRTANPAGVSPTYLALSTVATWAWAGYAAAQGLVEAAVSSAVAGAVLTGCCHYLARAGGWRPSATRTAAAWTVAAAAVTAAGGVVLLGLLLTLQVVIQHAPQMWTSLRSPDLTGVAAGTWRIMWASGAIWGLYAAVVGDGIFGAWAVVTLISATVTLVARRSKQHPPSRRRPAAEAP